MAIAYKHHGPGSTVQFSHYISQRLGELRDCVGHSEDEKFMWEPLKSTEDVPQSVLAHISSRCDKLSERIRTDKSEVQMLLELRAFLEPCQKCGGLGKLRHMVAQDHSKTEICPDCRGHGTRKESKKKTPS